MEINVEQLEHIKLSYNLKSDNEVYEWILETFPENVFFDNDEIMELINEAKKKVICMNDMELITKKEFEDFLAMQKRIFDLVENKTQELAMILYDRLPDGEICEFDIEESPFEKGCIFVEYEIYSSGESSLEQYNLPFNFLYNPLAPMRYKKVYDEIEQMKKERNSQLEQEKIEQDKANLEKFDRSEYERLKSKFE